MAETAVDNKAWISKAARLKVGGREYLLDKDLTIWKKTSNAMGTVWAPVEREKLKKVMEEAGSLAGKEICLKTPSMEEWGLPVEALHYIGAKLLEIPGTEAAAGYGRKADRGIVAVVPKQKVGGASVDIDDWAPAMERMFTYKADRMGTVHTHPGSMTSPSGEGGDMGTWKEFPGIHYIVARSGAIGAYLALGGVTWTLPWVYPPIAKTEVEIPKGTKKKALKKLLRRKQEVIPIQNPGVVLVGEDGTEDFKGLVTEKAPIVQTRQESMHEAWGWGMGMEGGDLFTGRREYSNDWDTIWSPHAGRQTSSSSFVGTQGSARGLGVDGMDTQMWAKVADLLVQAGIWGIPPIGKEYLQVTITEEGGRGYKTTPFALDRTGKGDVDTDGRMKEAHPIEMMWGPGSKGGDRWDLEEWNEPVGLGGMAEALWEVSYTTSQDGGGMIAVSREVRKRIREMEINAVWVTGVLTAYRVLMDGYEGEEAVKELQTRCSTGGSSGPIQGKGDRRDLWKALADQVLDGLWNGWFLLSTWIVKR